MYREIAKQIQQGKWRPFYVLCGTETFLMEEMIAHMKTHALRDADDTYNYSALDLEQVPVESLVQEAETLPFIGEKRLVVGRNAWFLTGSTGRAEVKHDVDALLAYAQSPLDSSIVVLTVPHAKLDERKKVVKQLKKWATVVRFTPLERGELRAWIKRKVSQFGARIEADAVERLIQLVGTELRLIYQECIKLATYVGEGGTVTSRHIDDIVPRSLEEDIFKLVDCIGRTDIEGALGVFYDLLKKREEPLKILSLIARQFRIMLQVKELSSRGFSQKQVASMLGLHPYPVKIASQQGKLFSEQALKALLLEANHADYAIKSGYKDKTLAVEWYIMRVNRWVKA